VIARVAASGCKASRVVLLASRQSVAGCVKRMLCSSKLVAERCSLYIQKPLPYLRSGECFFQSSNNYGVVDVEVEVEVVVVVAPPLVSVEVLVAVDVEELEPVSVLGVVVVVVDVEEPVSVVPLQAANEATIAKLAAVRAIVFMFNVINRNRLLLAYFVSVKHFLSVRQTSNFCQPGTAELYSYLQASQTTWNACMKLRSEYNEFTAMLEWREPGAY
jgi:hypothetical protein